MPPHHRAHIFGPLRAQIFSRTNPGTLIEGCLCEDNVLDYLHALLHNGCTIGARRPSLCTACSSVSLPVLWLSHIPLLRVQMFGTWLTCNRFAARRSQVLLDSVVL